MGREPVLISFKSPENHLLRPKNLEVMGLLGIEGAFYSPGAKTVIPAKVIGKFSIRIVPNMEPEQVDKLVIDYLNKVWHKRGSPNKFKSTLTLFS